MASDKCAVYQVYYEFMYLSSITKADDSSNSVEHILLECMTLAICHYLHVQCRLETRGDDSQVPESDFHARWICMSGAPVSLSLFFYTTYVSHPRKVFIGSQME